MMKFFLLIIFSIPVLCHADIVDCVDGPITKLIKEQSIPNCLTTVNLNEAKAKNLKPLCEDCKKQFLIKSTLPELKINLEDKKKAFFKVAINEYTKNVVNNIVNNLKLRKLPPTGATFSNSISQCKAKSNDELLKSCPDSTKALFKNSPDLKRLQSEVANELARLISKDEASTSKSNLLKRTPVACFIPEDEILYLSNTATEETLTPDLIKALSRIDISKFKNLDAVLLDESISDVYEGDISELGASLKTHPYLSNLFKTPASMVSFLKTIPDPKDLIQLQNKIYNKSSGDMLDSSIAEDCNKSFQKLAQTICSKEFENGDFKINAYENMSKLYDKSIDAKDEELSATSDLFNLNANVLAYCDSNERKINLSTVTNEISINLNEGEKQQSLEDYKSYKYNTDFKRLNNLICSEKDKNPPCNDNSYTCKIIQKFKLKNTGSSAESKLANSSNKEINSLLRSMIGDTNNLPQETKSILVAEGILPKEDGSLVPQPDIPERKPDFIAKQAAQSPTIKTVSSSSSAVSRSTRTQASTEDSYQPDYTSTSFSTTPQNDSISDLTNQVRDQSNDLRDVQDEIRRRLSNMKSKPNSLSDAKKIARDASRSVNRQISPAQETAFAESMMAPDNQRTALAQAGSTYGGAGSGSPGMSDTDTLQQKWEKGRMNAALKDMAGAQKVLAKDAPQAAAANKDGAPAEMTKVALNLADDPRVTLSENFNKKLDQNDPETQLIKVLLRSKNSFLLQVKTMNFKIVFNDKNSFNVLLESGDKKEAERIRPQLEMFLKKISTTSPLHNIFKT